MKNQTAQEITPMTATELTATEAGSRSVKCLTEFSFEAVNAFIHSNPAPEYEELQYAMLDLAMRHEKLQWEYDKL